MSRQPSSYLDYPELPDEPIRPLTEYLHLRVTKEMKEEVKAKDDPPEFCRQAIQEKLDREK